MEGRVGGMDARLGGNGAVAQLHGGEDRLPVDRDAPAERGHRRVLIPPGRPCDAI